MGSNKRTPPPVTTLAKEVQIELARSRRREQRKRFDERWKTVNEETRQLYKEIQRRDNEAALDRVKSMNRPVDQDAIEAGLIEWNNEKIKENASFISELNAATSYEHKWKEAIKNRITPERQQKINLQKEKNEKKEQERIAREIAKEKARQEREERKLNPPPKPPKPVKPPKKYHPPIDPETGEYFPIGLTTYTKSNKQYFQVRRREENKLKHLGTFNTKEKAELASIVWLRKTYGLEEEFFKDGK